MKKQDKMRFAKVMAVLAEIFDQGQEPSEFKIELYFQALAEFEIHDIEKAAAAIVKGRVYPAFPKPAEIIQEISGARENQAISAWIEVVEAIRRIGPYESVKFTDPLINVVIEFMGGWPATGEWLEDDLKWKQKEFERLYGVLKAQPADKEKYLPGIHEMSNKTEGFFIDHKVVVIGYQPVKLIAVGAQQ